ncbi:hypothetical protein [Sphingomonas sp. MMS24-J13]|uniref:hypothetical protein n=1 Tax=Sphingomonas sp. MMS24-J13 TaxID=3238686 RepID=UPI00384C33F8
MFELLGGDPDNCPRVALPVTDVATGELVSLLLPLVVYRGRSWAVFPNGNVMTLGRFEGCGHDRR